MDKLLKYHNPKTNQSPKYDKVSQKLALKSPRNSKKDQNENALKIKAFHHQHPYGKFIRGNFPQGQQFKKFVTLFYKGLNYSINNLKGPSDQFIKKKSITLPQQKQNFKEKFLMLDLDETLIHSIFNNGESDVTLEYLGNQFKFNLRPYCLQFLDKMSQYYSIYIFTASTIDYATPIVEYLNKKKKTIQGILHRKNCMQTNHGFYIKDLRIIKNRPIQKILIVDNLVHSFGLQIQNGIPILDFIDNKNDTQLYALQKLLIEIEKVQKINHYLKDKLKLRKMIDHKQEQIIGFFQKLNN